MRHNPDVAPAPAPHSVRLPALLLALAVALAACDGAESPASQDVPDAMLVWQGIAACADCAGIDTRLRLDDGPAGRGRYELVEAYLDEGGAEYYHEEGRWSRAGRILTLRATGGGVRRYRLDRDDRLRAVDRAGRDAGSAAPLLPVAGARQGL